MIELLVALGLIAGVVAAHEIGFRLDSLTRSADEAFDRRTTTAALVAFLVGFAYRPARYYCDGRECTRHRLLETRYYRRTLTRRTEDCAEGVHR